LEEIRKEVFFGMKHKIMLLFMAVALTAAVTGCKREVSPPSASETESGQTQLPSVSQPEETEKITEPMANPESGDALFSDCGLEGTVWEAGEDGCTILPTQRHGNVAEGPAPGTEAEGQWEKVRVTYNEGCTFQYAYLNQRAGTVRYAGAGPEDVEVQSNAVLFGQYKAGQGFRADRVFVYWFE